MRPAHLIRDGQPDIRKLTPADRLRADISFCAEQIRFVRRTDKSPEARKWAWDMIAHGRKTRALLATLKIEEPKNAD